jgi:glycosyltransferase involved in cell wall biosynthesis
MHIGVLFPMDSVEISFDRPAHIWGRAVANHGFLQALATSLAPANVRPRLTVFVPTRQDVQRLRKTLLPAATGAVAIVAHIDIASYLKKSPIDVLHVPAPQLGMAAHIRNFLSGTPFVITGVTHSLGNEHFLGWALQNNANGITAGDCLICTTPTAQAVVESAFAQLRATQPDFRTPATHVIPLGISREAFTGQTAMTRQQLGLADDDFVILSFGRFNHQFKMDVLPLLNLAALLKGRSKRQLRLLLAGSADNGVYAAFVQEQATLSGVGAMVRVLPNIGEAQKAGLFRAADAFLSLSDNIQETFGLTVVEALAAGLPVVASDWNGYKALVQHGVTGFLVPTKTLAAHAEWEAQLSLQPDALTHLYCAQTTAIDLPAACAHLVGLAEDRDLARRMGRAASASAAQYDWSAVIERYLGLWTRLREAQLKGDAAADTGVRRSSALRFLGDFSAYPSSLLSLDDRFVTSALGRQVIERRQPLSLYEHMEPVLDLQIMTQVLHLFLAETALGDVARDLQRELHQEPSRVCQNALWLYKYGFLEWSGPALR